MKFLLICLFVVAIVVISECGFADINSVRIAYNRNGDPFKCSEMGPICTEDCTTLMMCSNKPEPIAESPCTAPNQYCVNGACTSNRGSCNPTAGSGSSKFDCMGVGIFPDPSDCTQYHECKADGSSETFQCNAGFVFNSKLQMCQVGRTQCTKISCSKASEANTFIAYGSNPAYYAFCSKSGADFSTLMFKCPNEEEFDTKTKACKFKCKAKGNFQNPKDCGKYFYCSGVNAQPISAECPVDLIFDGTGCNRDKNKCEFKPDLTESKEVDKNIIDLIGRMQDQIITKICATDADCLKVTQKIVAKKFRAKTVADGIEYFVSVTVEPSNEFHHVKIKIETTPPKEELKDVTKPKNANSVIESF